MNVFFMACATLAMSSLASAQQCTTIAAAATGTLDFLPVALAEANLIAPLSVTDNAPAYTVFAPTDEAFLALLDSLNITGLDGASEELLAQLPTVLLTHVAVGTFPAASLEDGQMLTTLANVSLTVSIAGDVVSVSAANGGMANVFKADAATGLCGGSVIHLIDTVLLPEVCTPLLDALMCKEDPESPECMTQGVATAAATMFPALAELFASEDVGYTVFVPNNAVANKIVAAVTAGTYTTAELEKILQGHIAEGVVKAEDLTVGLKITTIAGTTLTVESLTPDVTIKGPAGDIIKVSGANFQGLVEEGMTVDICGDSVSHVLDGFFALANGTTMATSPPPPKASAATGLIPVIASALAAAAVLFL